MYVASSTLLRRGKTWNSDACQRAANTQSACSHEENRPRPAVPSPRTQLKGLKILCLTAENSDAHLRIDAVGRALDIGRTTEENGESTY